MVIIRPADKHDTPTIVHLMRLYLAWHHDRYAEDSDFIDFLFQSSKLEADLREIPAELSGPSGTLLLAEEDGAPAGFVGLRAVDEDCCEMKRMFVTAAFRGRHLGLTLGEAIIEEGRRLGYRRMLLDTGSEHIEAQRLYRRLGFQQVRAYYPAPPRFQERLCFMERSLSA